jgi:hypothetical protein
MDSFSTLLSEFGLMRYAAIFAESDAELAAPAPGFAALPREGDMNVGVCPGRLAQANDIIR